MAVGRCSVLRHRDLGTDTEDETMNEHDRDNNPPVWLIVPISFILFLVFALISIGIKERGWW